MSSMSSTGRNDGDNNQGLMFLQEDQVRKHVFMLNCYEHSNSNDQNSENQKRIAY